jgi:hypothetical protein
MMTLTTDARSKEVFKKVQAKNSVFYERTFGKRSKSGRADPARSALIENGGAVITRRE